MERVAKEADGPGQQCDSQFDEPGDRQPDGRHADGPVGVMAVGGVIEAPGRRERVPRLAV